MSSVASCCCKTQAGWPRHCLECLGLRSRSQAPAWERLSSKLCFAACPTTHSTSSRSRSQSARRSRDIVVGSIDSEREDVSPPCWVVLLRSLAAVWLENVTRTRWTYVQRSLRFGTRAKRSFGDMRSQAGAWDRGRRMRLCDRMNAKGPGGDHRGFSFFSR